MQKINLTFDAATVFNSEFERLYDASDADQVVPIAYAAEYVSQLATQLMQGCTDSDSYVEDVIDAVNRRIAAELADYQSISYLNVYVGTIIASINGDYDLAFVDAGALKNSIGEFDYLLVHLYIDAMGNVYYEMR